MRRFHAAKIATTTMVGTHHPTFLPNGGLSKWPFRGGPASRVSRGLARNSLHLLSGKSRLGDLLRTSSSVTSRKNLAVPSCPVTVASTDRPNATSPAEGLTTTSTDRKSGTPIEATTAAPGSEPRGTAAICKERRSSLRGVEARKTRSQHHEMLAPASILPLPLVVVSSIGRRVEAEPFGAGVEPSPGATGK